MSEIVAYIESLELPAPRSRGPAEAAPPPPAFTAGPQGFTIGSQLTEFTPQVAASVRPAVSNSLLLAQLASDKANPGAQDPQAWFASFNTVLGRVGWMPVGGLITSQQVSDRNAELHKAIIPVLMAALGPAAAVGSIIISVLQGLQSMNEDSPWITLFQRKSQKANVAQFGLNFVDGGDGGGASLKSVYFGLTATKVLTQVLFVKLSDANATVRSEQRDAMLSSAAVTAAQDSLQAKVGAHIVDNIAQIEI